MNYATDIALDEFNRIATLDTNDPMPTDDMLELQVRLYRWQTRNFNGCTDWQMALGMIEEFGEFEEADNSEDRYDAVGDVAVFGCQLLTLNRLGLNIAIADADHLAEAMRLGEESHSLMRAAGRMAKVVLKGSQKIRGLADKDLYRAEVYKATVDMFASVMVRRYVALGPVITNVAYNVVLKRGKGHKAIPSAQD